MKVAALVLVLAALPGAALAQQEKTVGGLTVNLGLMSAEQALRAEGHREAHPATFPSGSQHILITLAESRSGKRIGDAAVVVQVRDPRGGAVEKPLLRTQAAGQPDYSELFVFGWSGKYSLRVRITPPGAKTIETVFSVEHRT